MYTTKSAISFSSSRRESDHASTLLMVTIFASGAFLPQRLDEPAAVVDVEPPDDQDRGLAAAINLARD